MKTTERAKFNVGDKVSWTSSVHGNVTTKEGSVVGVVPAHMGQVDEVLKHMDERHRAKIELRSMDSVRAHESYIVSVPDGYRPGKHMLYRPVVSKLRLVSKAKAK